MIEVGQQLGGYTIQSRIGRGGMGEVFLAQHRRVSRRAAVKVLVPELSQKATVLDRFFNEARATSLIKHPGIVEILDCDVIDGQAFIIMEFLEGESLGGYLKRAGPLDQDLTFLLGAGAAAASAVAAAHATGIVHRDLKPDNIYLHLSTPDDPTVTVKILDFGIAKLLLTDSGPSQTTTGMLLGTPTYMSPEQCRGAGRVDARSDVYSLGCILYEGLCGSPPFVREGVGDLIVAHVSEQPERPSTHVAALPPALDSLVVRMLAKKPEERPQSMEDVRRELRDCARGLGINHDGPLRPRAPVERPPTTSETGPEQPTPANHLGRSQTSGPGAMPLGSDPGTGAVNPPHRPTTPYAATATPLPPSRASGAMPRQGARGASTPLGTGIPSAEPRATEKPTTLGSTAAEVRVRTLGTPNRKKRWLAVAAGAVAVIGGALALVGTKGRTPTPIAVKSESTTHVAAAAERSTTIPIAEPPTAAPVAVRTAQPSPLEAPETVSIDIQGVPARTKVTVDGQPAALPLQLERGPQVHRIVLRPPGAPERALELDGTKDRIIELAFDQRPTPASTSSHSKSERPISGKDSGHRSPGLSREPAAGSPKKSAPRSTDREAITDI